MVAAHGSRLLHTRPEREEAGISRGERLLPTEEIEHLTSAVYLDKREDLDEYTIAMDSLSIATSTPRHTHHLLSEIIKSLD